MNTHSRHCLGEGGAAFAFVILVMLAVLALAHGTLVAALAELAGSRAAVRDLETRAAAEVGLQSALALMPGDWMDSVAPGDTRTAPLGVVGRAGVAASMRRLSPESWLVEGTAESTSGQIARTMRMAWSLDPLARVSALPAVVTVGPGASVVLGGTVDASMPAAVVPPMQPGDCDAWLAALVADYATAPVPVVTVAADTAGVARLGLLDLDALIASAPDSFAGAGTPAPAESLGACLADETWNWGSPEEPWLPCGEHLPLRVATGDVVVSGGVGQGMLVVNGELTLTNEARFYGLVITAGALRLELGAAFEGMALAAGGLAVDPGATLRGSACWALRVLDAQRDVLGRLLPVVSAGRIGPL